MRFWVTKFALFQNLCLMKSNSNEQGVTWTLYAPDAHSRPFNDNGNFFKLLNSLRVLNSSLHSLEKAVFHTKSQFLKLPKKTQFYKQRISYTYAKKLKLLIIDVCWVWLCYFLYWQHIEGLFNKLPFLIRLIIISSLMTQSIKTLLHHQRIRDMLH